MEGLFPLIHQNYSKLDVNLTLICSGILPKRIDYPTEWIVVICNSLREKHNELIEIKLHVSDILSGIFSNYLVSQKRSFMMWFLN
jgi:hypothetical protein